MTTEKLGECDYCLREGRKKNLARVHIDEKTVRHFCPRCLPEVEENLRSMNWIRDSYIIEYPYRN